MRNAYSRLKQQWQRVIVTQFCQSNLLKLSIFYVLIIRQGLKTVVLNAGTLHKVKQGNDDIVQVSILQHL